MYCVGNLNQKPPLNLELIIDGTHFLQILRPTFTLSDYSLDTTRIYFAELQSRWVKPHYSSHSRSKSTTSYLGRAAVREVYRDVMLFIHSQLP